MKFSISIFVFLLCNLAYSQKENLPKGFKYIKHEIPSIKMELKYVTKDNFVGTFVAGYYTNKGILTTQAVKALKKVQKELIKKDLSLIIYDAYRPQKAVNHFVRWAKSISDTLTKQKYYPNVAKKNLFKKGYIASHSRHSSGSTVDLSIISLKTGKALDMGSMYDYFGKKSWVNYTQLTKLQKKNRQLLQQVMLKHGFRNYPKEWWHFTLRYEPYRNQYFDFNVK